MADDVGELLNELGRDETPERDQLTERARRQRMAAAMNARLTALDAPARSRLRWWAIAPAAVAAAAALALVAGLLAQRSETVELAPEPARGPARSPEQKKSVPAPAETTQQPAVAAMEAPAPPRRPSVAPRPSTNAPERSEAPEPQPPEPQPPEPSLAAQNELFQAAVRAERRGDDQSALVQLDTLLQRYPSSVLAADARIRKVRILARLGRDGDARAAAKQYLDSHPEGAAADEARKTSGEPAPITP